MSIRTVHALSGASLLSITQAAASASYDADIGPCWDAPGIDGALLRDLCCHPPKVSCFQGEFTPERCCPNFGDSKFAGQTGGQCSRGCAQAANRGAAWASMEFHWSMHEEALVIHRRQHEEILKEASMLLDSGTVLSQLLADDVVCLVGKIWYLHYFVKYGSASQQIAPSINFAALILLSWLRTCAHIDSRFREELWHFVRLTPALVRYTVWLYAPSEAWPSIPSGTLIDIGANRGLDTLFYSFCARSHSQSIDVLSVDSSITAVRSLRYRVKHLNVSVFHRALLDDSASDSSESSLGELRTYVDANDQVHFSREKGEHVRSVQYSSCSRIAMKARQPLWYMKIDIEEFGWPCVKSLCTLPRDRLPKFISVENPGTWHKVDIVGFLEDCGYVRFKLVRQEPHYHIMTAPNQQDCLHRAHGCVMLGGEPYWWEGGSGPFGDDATDWRMGQHWRGAHEVRSELAILQNDTSAEQLFLWFEGDLFDVHAELG